MSGAEASPSRGGRAASAAGFVVALLCGVAFLSRAYLSWRSSQMAAGGAGEEALFAILSDPLWRIELPIAKLLGNPGTIGMMNTLGTVSWAAIFGVSVAVARPLWGRRTMR